MTLHLFEFVESGFFVARDKAHAFELVREHLGDDFDAADYRRQVPDDEALEVWAEESWEDPRERSEEKLITINGGPRSYTLWGVKLTASEWILWRDEKPGYAFGGCE